MTIFIGSPDRRHVLTLLDGEQVKAFDSWTVPDGESSDLVERIDALVSSITDLSGVIVVTGPGSFSFSRVGVAAANALAFAHDVPILGVDQLQLAVMYAHLKGISGDVLAAVPTIRESWFVGKGNAKEGLPSLQYARISQNELKKYEENHVFVGENLTSMYPDAIEYLWDDKETILALVGEILACMGADRPVIHPCYVLPPNIGKHPQKS